MKIECLKKFAQDLRKVGIEAIPLESETYVRLNINCMEFYFYKDNSKQYDGWGTGNKEIIKDMDKDKEY